MKRINHLVTLISSCNNVIDVGSDHCYLAIKLLQQKRAKYILNIEVNEGPWKQGIKNLDKYHLLNQTDNIINDGLKNINQKILVKPQYDYLVIAGMGAKNIVNILKENKLHINNFILQPNNHVHLLRKYLINHHYYIIKEDMVCENNIYYPIIVCKKSLKCQIYNKTQLYFGKLNNIVNCQLSYAYLKYQLTYFKRFETIKKYQQLIKLTTKLLKKYESKWNL